LKKIAVLVSKEDRCLRQLIADSKEGLLHAGIACVLSNHADLQAVAASAGLEFAHSPADDADRHFDWLFKSLQRHTVDAVVLARYMRILPPKIVRAFAGKIINVHPALTPSYPGATPYMHAFESGVRIHGCTAHFVTEQLDEGPVIEQDVFRIDVGRDSIEDVRRKGLELEAQTLGRAVRLFVDDQLQVAGGKVLRKPGAG
jgi:formyltetrahydrofolate deformylase